MGAAFGWGLLSASSLVIGAVIALLFRIPLRVIGLIMGFGAGVLISAVAFDLVEEAAGKSTGHGALVAGLFSGCLVFFAGDRLIDHLGGGNRKKATGAEEEGEDGGSPLSRNSSEPPNLATDQGTSRSSRTSVGSFRTRSPIMFRCISSVPPRIDSDGAVKASK